MINVLYFASLKDTLGMSAEEIDLVAVTGEDAIANGRTIDVGSLRDWLCQRGEPWKSALRQQRLMTAVNQEIVQAGKVLADGDEVAFFPPVTGG